VADLDSPAPLFITQPPQADGRRVGVLLSHGFTGSPVSIRPWAQYLADHGYSVSVPLLPGHGTTVADMLPTRFADYEAAIESAYADLAAQCDVVVVGGLSMGGTLALRLAQRHPEIAGLLLVNAAVTSTNKQLLLLPVLKHIFATFPAISNDIKKADSTESGYDRTPLKALASFVATWKQTRADLPKVACPLVLFRSAEDHIVDPTSAPIILNGISSTDKQEVVLTNSYHVATLDNDAPEVFATSLAALRRWTSDA